MAIPDANITFRAGSVERQMLKALMQLFERDRSWILRRAVRVFFLVMFDLAKLEVFLREWKVFSGNKQQDGVTHQLKLNFNQQEHVTFHPRIWFSKQEIAE